MSEMEGPTTLTANEVEQLLCALEEAKELIDAYSNYTAEQFVVRSEDEIEERTQELRKIKLAMDTLEVDRVAMVTPHNNVVKEINGYFKTVASKTDIVYRAIKQGIKTYLDKVEQERIEQERKAREAAAKEQARLQKLADAAREKGKEERAETLEFRAQAVTAAPPPPMPKAAGTSRRTTWTFTVTDPALIPREYLLIDEKKIGAVVRAMKADTNIPGISVRSETDLSVRGG